MLDYTPGTGWGRDLDFGSGYSEAVRNRRPLHWILDDRKHTVKMNELRGGIHRRKVETTSAGKVEVSDDDQYVRETRRKYFIVEIWDPPNPPPLKHTSLEQGQCRPRHFPSLDAQSPTHSSGLTGFFRIAFYCCSREPMYSKNVVWQAAQRGEAIPWPLRYTRALLRGHGYARQCT